MWRRTGVALCVAALACVSCDDTTPTSPATRTQGNATLGFTGTSGTRQTETGVVINELAARLAPNEECSEFVELRNNASEEQSLGGWRLAVSGPDGSPALYATIPVGTVLSPGCHLLIATQPSGLLRDVASMCNLADNGGLALMLPDGTITDQVGMSTGSGFHEGTPLAQFSVSATRKSYGRVRGDTDNNALDFVFGSATPQNSFEDCVTP